MHYDKLQKNFKRTKENLRNYGLEIEHFLGQNVVSLKKFKPKRKQSDAEYYTRSLCKQYEPDLGYL